MNASDFILKFFDHSFEGHWSILSIFWQRKNFALEGLADASDSITHLGALLVN